MKKILVTGAAGFIGYHLIKCLCEKGHKVIGIDNLNDYYDVNLKKDRLKELESYSTSGLFDFRLIDITHRTHIQNLFSEHTFDAVVNLAAQAGVRYSLENPHSYIDSNITGFLNILEGCRFKDIPWLFYASSSSIYGGNRDLPFTEFQKADQPCSLYGVSKKANELMAHAYSHLFGMNTVGLRFFTVYGPWGRPDMALFKFTRNIMENKEVEVFNYGKHTRSFTYIDDIVEGIGRLIEKFIDKPGDGPNKPYRIFNIGGDHSVGLMEYIHVIEEYLEKKAKIKFLPMQPGDVEKTEADTTLLESETGFIPRTNIQEGIKHFIEWYIKYYHV